MLSFYFLCSCVVAWWWFDLTANTTRQENVYRWLVCVIDNTAQSFVKRIHVEVHNTEKFCTNDGDQEGQIHYNTLIIFLISVAFTAFFWRHNVL